jgi:hypothetical protein
MRKRYVPDIYTSRSNKRFFRIKASPEHGIGTINPLGGFLAKVATKDEGGM